MQEIAGLTSLYDECYIGVAHELETTLDAYDIPDVFLPFGRYTSKRPINA